MGWCVWRAAAGVAAWRCPQLTLVAARLGATGAKAEAEATQRARVRAAVFMVCGGSVSVMVRWGSWTAAMVLVVVVGGRRVNGVLGVVLSDGK